jgi:hypothetical protein
MGKITEGREETVFKTLSYEDFVQKSAALERWCTLLPPENKTLEILREAVDIKKVNSSFIKSGPNDNLIVDAYCQLYMEVTPTLDLDVKVEEAIGDGDKGGGKDGPDQGTKRIKGVGRRELLRKAEAAGINPALVSAQILALRQTMAAKREQVDNSSGEARILVTSAASDADETEPQPPSSAAATRTAPERFFDADDDDDDESELSELDDIQSLEGEVRLFKTSSPMSSVARTPGLAGWGQMGAGVRADREVGETRRPVSSRGPKTPSDDGMQDVQGGAGSRSLGGESALG